LTKEQKDKYLRDREEQERKMIELSRAFLVNERRKEDDAKIKSETIWILTNKAITIVHATFSNILSEFFLNCLQFLRLIIYSVRSIPEVLILHAK
jgi:hypothetical protein